jgi:hypothetical protein
MKKLQIDFTGRGRRSPWAARILLAAALALCLDMGLSYRELRASLALHEAKLRQAGPVQAAASGVSAEEVAAARETVDRLATPWNRLFGALESAANDKVALLGIEPDPKAGTVVISGDSKDYLAALSYVLDLGRNEGLERVQLVRHEVKADDPQAPVSFAVSARWSEARP